MTKDNRLLGCEELGKKEPEKRNLTDEQILEILSDEKKLGRLKLSSVELLVEIFKRMSDSEELRNKAKEIIGSKSFKKEK